MLLMTIKEVAAVLGVTTKTIKRYEAAGGPDWVLLSRLKPDFRVGHDGWMRLYRVEQVKELATLMGRSWPAELDG